MKRDAPGPRASPHDGIGVVVTDPVPGTPTAATEATGSTEGRTRPAGVRGRAGSLLLSAQGLTMVIGAVFIGLFIGLTPPGYGLDEQAHVYRTYQLSQGVLFPSFDSVSRTYVAKVPRSLYDLEQQGWFDSNTVPREVPFFHRRDVPDRDAYRRLEGLPLDAGDPQATDVTQTLPNFPVVYLPAAGAIALVRAFGADTGTVALAAKIGAALMYLAMAFVAVWFARRLRLRWLVFVAALLPAALFQASVISADTFCNGAALILMSMVLTMLMERAPVGRATLVGLVAASVGVMLSKPTYAVLVLLVLLLPVDVFGSRRTAMWFKIGLLAGAAVLVGLTLFIASKGTVAVSTQRPDLAATINAVEQLKGLLVNPIHGVTMVGTTVLTYGESWVQGVVGLFGYNTIAVPYPFVVVTVLTLAAAAFYAERLRRGPAWSVLVAGLLVGLAIIVWMYLTFNPVGAESAAGVQGRYFVPCVVAVGAGAAGVLPIRVAMRRATARVFFPVAVTTTLIVSAVTWWVALT